MNYPNVTLRIKNQVPMLELWTDEKQSKTIIKGNKGIDTSLIELCEVLDLPVRDANLEEVMHQARSGNESLLEFGDIDFAKQDFDFSDVMAEVEAAYSKYELPLSQEHLEANSNSTELLAELKKNWKEDALASFIEEMYNILIARTFYLAGETSVSTIVLIDDRQDARLREKMAKELATVEEIEFMVS